MGARPQENRINDEVNDGDNFINEPGQANVEQPQAQADQNPINDDVLPEADYSEILRTLRGTESFWQRETKSYKDFKNALTNLNLPQLIQENRGLTADIRGRNVQVLKGYSNMQEPEVQQVPFMEQMWE